MQKTSCGRYLYSTTRGFLFQCLFWGVQFIHRQGLFHAIQSLLLDEPIRARLQLDFQALSAGADLAVSELLLYTINRVGLGVREHRQIQSGGYRDGAFVHEAIGGIPIGHDQTALRLKGGLDPLDEFLTRGDLLGLTGVGLGLQNGLRKAG